MSPQGMIFFAAVALGFLGKLAFPQSSLRVAFFAALAFPLAMAIYFGDIAPIAAVLIAPLSLAGAVIGVIAGKVSRKAWTVRRAR